MSRRGGVVFALCALLSLFASIAPSRALAAGPPLVVGLSGKYPPFNYVDGKGELAGFDVEFAEALCKRLDRPCEYRILPWDGILAALLAHKIDVIIGSMAITEERSKQVAFSSPYYESGAQFYLRPGAPPSTTAGFRVGVTLGTTYEQHVRDRFPNAEVVTYKGDVEVVQDMQSGRLDGMVTDRLVGAHLAQVRGVKILPDGPPLFVERVGIPTAPGDEALRSAIDQGVKEIRASSFYGQLFDKYFGAAARPGESHGFAWGDVTRLLLRGLGKTIQVSFVGLGLGALLSVLLSFLLVGGPKLLRTSLSFLVDLVRSTPFIVQLFAIYFGLPAVGVKLSAFTSAALAIGLHSAAYLSEIVKGAYLGIAEGQHRAATALGLSTLEKLRHVIVPQMVPRMTAPVLNTVVAMIKDSAIASVVSVPELTLEAQKIIGATFRPLEVYALAAVLYALVTWPLLLLGRFQERRLAKKGLFHAGREAT